MKIHKTMI